MKASDLEAKLGYKKKKSLSELKELLRVGANANPNFCLFLGAGASRSSGIRTAGEMVAQWRHKLCEQNSGPIAGTPEQVCKFLHERFPQWYDPAKEYSCLIEHNYPVATSRRKFIEEEVEGKIPSIGYAYLVRIAEAGFMRTIFTTNFDDLLNEAFYQLSKERPLVCAHDSSVHSISVSSRRAKIIKLHGDYLFDDLKNSSAETEVLEQNMNDKLKEFLKEYGLVVVG